MKNYSEISKIVLYFPFHDLGNKVFLFVNDEALNITTKKYF